jgi:tungstate transport system ATP-binding protein
MAGVLPVLRVTNLSKSVGQRLLLDIPELVLEPGKLTMLRGRNGAGKTTLLKILAGLNAPDHADVRIGDVSRSWSSAKKQLRAQTIYLHQNPYLFDRSVAENIAYGLRRRGLRGSGLNARVRSALEWAGMDHLRDRNARHLSGGERQRVVLTRARVLSPKLLLLDEPVTNMDQESREQTWFLIRRLRSEGVAMMVTSHGGGQVVKLADQTLELVDGRLRLCRQGINTGTDAPSSARSRQR